MKVLEQSFITCSFDDMFEASSVGLFTGLALSTLSAGILYIYFFISIVHNLFDLEVP